jgi:hypothetical protein
LIESVSWLTLGRKSRPFVASIDHDAARAWAAAIRTDAGELPGCPTIDALSAATE